jgi:hypothetical protein
MRSERSGKERQQRPGIVQREARNEKPQKLLQAPPTTAGGAESHGTGARGGTCRSGRGRCTTRRGCGRRSTTCRRYHIWCEREGECTHPADEGHMLVREGGAGGHARAERGDIRRGAVRLVVVGLGVGVCVSGLGGVLLPSAGGLEEAETHTIRAAHVRVVAGVSCAGVPRTLGIPCCQLGGWAIRSAAFSLTRSAGTDTGVSAVFAALTVAG